MCNKAINNYPYALEFVCKWYETHKICDKAIDTHLFTMNNELSFWMLLKVSFINLSFINVLYSSSFMFFIFSSIPDQYKTQEICDLVDSLYPSLVIYCLDICNSKMCNEAVDDSLAALKLLPNLFVTSKMIKNLYTVLHADDSLFFSDEDSGVVMK